MDQKMLLNVSIHLQRGSQTQKVFQDLSVQKLDFSVH